MSSYPVIEHGEPARGRTGRWLLENRFRIALLIGTAEIVAIIFTDFTKWGALLLAGVIFALYVYAGRKAGSWTMRQFFWIAAASQILPVVFAILAFFIALLAVVAIVALLGIVLFMLLFDRR